MALGWVPSLCRQEKLVTMSGHLHSHWEPCTLLFLILQTGKRKLGAWVGAALVGGAQARPPLSAQAQPCSD